MIKELGLFEILCDKMNEAILVTNKDGLIQFVNHQSTLLFGYDKKELVSYTVQSIIPSFFHHNNITSDDVDIEKEVSISVGNKVERCVCVERKCLNINEVYYYAYFIKDVSSYKLNEELLKESDRNLKRIYALAKIGIWEWEQETDTVTWSDEIYKIKGVDLSEPPTPFADQAQYYTPESWGLLNAAVQKAFKTGETYEIQIDYVRKDGSIRNAIVNGGVKKDKNGNVVGLYGTVQDITARKNEELLLLENESNLSAIIENTTDVIWAIDKDRNIIYLNEVFRHAFQRDIGVRLEKGMNLRDTLPDQIRESWLARFDEAFQNVRLEYEDTIMVEGHLNYIDVSLNPIVLKGEVVGVSVFGRNITERKRIENALRESESQLAELVNATFEAIVISKNGFILNANEPFSKMVGYSQSEVVGMPIKSFVPKMHHEKVMLEITKEVSEAYESHLLNRDGTLVAVEVHARSIINSKNERVRFTAIRDISERKKAELELKKSEEKYREIFENIQDVFFKTDLSGTILEVSPSALPMLGYTREDVIGLSVLKLYEYPEQRQDVLNQLLSTGQIKDFEVKLFNKSGKAIPLSLNARLIYNEEGIPASMEGTIRDISSRIEIEQERKQQNEILQRQNKELEQFTYVASHDLQEPLRTLISVSDLLGSEFKEGEQDQEKIDKYLGFIVQSAHRMQDLVKGLSDLSRLGREKEVVLVNCNQLLKDVLLDLDRAISDSKAHINSSDLPEIKGYGVGLRLLFQNLISNAIKFRKRDEPLEISISVERQDNAYLFSIKDNGIGIPEKDQEKIFVIFKRLHNRNEYEGTGIGLAHCKKIVELHGGSIWVESVLGQGSTFSFIIPII